MMQKLLVIGGTVAIMLIVGMVALSAQNHATPNNGQPTAQPRQSATPFRTAFRSQTPQPSQSLREGIIYTGRYYRIGVPPLWHFSHTLINNTIDRVDILPATALPQGPFPGITIQVVDQAIEPITKVSDVYQQLQFTKGMCTITTDCIAYAGSLSPHFRSQASPIPGVPWIDNSQIVQEIALVFSHNQNTYIIKYEYYANQRDNTVETPFLQSLQSFSFVN